MGWQKGQSGNPAGRSAGFHRNKFLVDEVFKDYNPLQRLKELSLTTDDPNLRGMCDKELSQYFAPKLKAIEMAVDTNSPLQFSVNIKGSTDGAGTTAKSDNVQCDKDSK